MWKRLFGILLHVIVKLELFSKYYGWFNDYESNFNEKKVTCKTQNFYILLVFLLITALLIGVSIYWYLIKYQGKHLLPFYNTNRKVNKCHIDSINWKWVI